VLPFPPFLAKSSNLRRLYAFLDEFIWPINLWSEAREKPHQHFRGQTGRGAFICNSGAQTVCI